MLKTVFLKSYVFCILYLFLYNWIIILWVARQLKYPLTHGGLTPTVLLQLIFLYAVIGPLAKGGNTGHWVWMCVRVRGWGVEVEIKRSQQGGGWLAAGGGRAAVGDGGVRSLERSGVFKWRHRDGSSRPRLCW